MHMLAPKPLKEATLAATQASFDPTIDATIGPAMVPLPKPKKLTSRRVLYGQNSGLFLGAQWPY
jgi:hypothetical protein